MKSFTDWVPAKNVTGHLYLKIHKLNSAIFFTRLVSKSYRDKARSSTTHTATRSCHRCR